ncbi:MAG: ABC transporter ATP-binding protein [Peptococcaceae bacterium]|nr:ABC transporter ATP-binding protein [Peptococcaceae bacterium]
MALLTIRGLEKRYPGAKALNGVDMEMEAGRIYGLLGPNMSGKTTLLKTIACLLQPDAGDIVYPREARRGEESKKTVSLLPDAVAFPTWMTVGDAFRYYEDMYDDYSAERADSMAKMLEVPPAKRINGLSKGMQERVALGLAFSRETSIYLLDEPLGGIDPVGKMKVMESILAMPLEQSSILLSTHLVKDVEAVFDSVLFLSAGRIVFSGDCEEIRESQGKTVEQVYLEVFANVKPD